MQNFELITVKQKLRGLAYKIKWQIVTLLFFFLDSMVLATIGTTKGKDPRQKKRLVFIRTDAIGDFILWTASIEDLLELYPKDEYSWTLVGSAVWTDLAKELLVFDEIVPIESGNFSRPRNVRYRYTTLARLRQISADIVIHPTHSRDFSTGDAVARAIRAKMKIASAGDYANVNAWQKAVGNRFYSKIVPLKSGLDSKNPTMELIRSAEFLSALSGKPIKSKMPDLRKIASKLPIEILKLPEDMSMLPSNELYFVIFPGAGWRHREWGFEKFNHVANDLQKKYGWVCVFCGSEQDRKIFSSDIESAGLKQINLMGQTNLLELISVIANAKLIVTNETSAAHIGAACRVPTVCVAGGGHYGRFVPWKTEVATARSELSCVSLSMPCFNCNWQCIYKLSGDNPVPCIANIEPEHVIQRVHQILVESAALTTHATIV